MSKINSQRKNCKDVFNSFLVVLANYCGLFDFPYIDSCYEIPNRLIAFSKAISCRDYNQWVHFFEDDYLFERIWRNPGRYLKLLKNYNGVILPDFRILSENPRYFNCRDESVLQPYVFEHMVVFLLHKCYTMCMKENLIHYRTSVCNINYHMVWSVKYRRKILNAEVEAYLKELVQQIADDKGFAVQLFECGEMDHVHCFVTAPPKLSVTAIVKYLKGITGRKLFEEFPDIRSKLWKGELWNHSYYCETIGSVSEENIKRYIEHQGKSY